MADELHRADGSKKGPGFLGTLRRPDGSVSTEISVGVEINGKEMEIPTLVPTLSQQERDWLINNDISDPHKIPRSIIEKAVAHAKDRMAQGKPVFAEGEFKMPSDTQKAKPKTETYTVHTDKGDYDVEVEVPETPEEHLAASKVKLAAANANPPEAHAANAGTPGSYVGDVIRYGGNYAKGAAEGALSVVNPLTYVRMAQDAYKGAQAVPAYVKGFSTEDVTKHIPTAAAEYAQKTVEDPEALGSTVASIETGRAVPHVIRMGGPLGTKVQALGETMSPTEARSAGSLVGAPHAGLTPAVLRGVGRGMQYVAEKAGYEPPAKGGTRTIDAGDVTRIKAPGLKDETTVNVPKEEIVDTTQHVPYRAEDPGPYRPSAKAAQKAEDAAATNAKNLAEIEEAKKGKTATETSVRETTSATDAQGRRLSQSRVFKDEPTKTAADADPDAQLRATLIKGGMSPEEAAKTIARRAARGMTAASDAPVGRKGVVDAPAPGAVPAATVPPAAPAGTIRLNGSEPQFRGDRMTVGAGRLGVGNPDDFVDMSDIRKVFQPGGIKDAGPNAVSNDFDPADLGVSDDLLKSMEVVSDEPKGPQNNGSGESKASTEAINRFDRAKNGGQVVVEQAGRPDKPIIDSDHYVQTRDNLQPGQRLVRVDPKTGARTPVDQPAAAASSETPAKPTIRMNPKGQILGLPPIKNVPAELEQLWTEHGGEEGAELFAKAHPDAFPKGLNKTTRTNLVREAFAEKFNRYDSGGVLPESAQREIDARLKTMSPSDARSYMLKAPNAAAFNYIWKMIANGAGR